MDRTPPIESVVSASLGAINPQMIRTLIRLNCLLCLVLSTTLLRVAEGQEVVMDADDWVKVVEEYRENLRVLRLEPYPPALVREYFKRFEPSNDPFFAFQDAGWKLDGLLAYGNREDITDVAPAISQMKKVGTSAIINETNMELAQLVIPARFGDRNALQRILDSSVPWLLAVCRTNETREHLAKMAADSNLSYSERVDCLKYLRDLGDPRSFEIAFSDELYKAWKRNSGSLEHTFLWVYVTGDEEFHDVNTAEEARMLAKKKGIVVKPFAKVRIRGSVDWAKFKNVSSEPTPMPRSLPKKIRQPKPEEPTAAAPTQKPPANNAGTLIAIAAAIVGFLAALIWFLRKK